jgi:DTW domain-containing protein YfiP
MAFYLIVFYFWKLMSRVLCGDCQRPEAACICAFISPVKNSIDVIVLQHPSEVTQSKGTVALLALSLSACQVIVGENFSKDERLENILAKYQPLLLYPSDKSQELSSSHLAHINNGNLTYKEGSTSRDKPFCLLILDGTWKKAYRMFMLCEQLQHLPQVCLPVHLANAGQYQIRKVAKENALSSLEACCYALGILESNIEVTIKDVGKYNNLIEKFVAFNQFQLSFRPNSKDC